MKSTHTTLANWQLSSLDDTDRLGELLFRMLPSDSCVCLVGTLGAGKTRLAQATISAAGIARDEITSPTFSLIKSYQIGERLIHHLDAYRIVDDDEFLELGVDEFIGAQDNLSLIEWADRVVNVLPEETLWIVLECIDSTNRMICLQGETRRWGELAHQLVSQFRSPSS